MLRATDNRDLSEMERMYIARIEFMKGRITALETENKRLSSITGAGSSATRKRTARSNATEPRLALAARSGTVRSSSTA